jgi:hypothetical protein
MDKLSKNTNSPNIAIHGPNDWVMRVMNVLDKIMLAYLIVWGEMAFIHALSQWGCC